MNLAIYNNYLLSVGKTSFLNYVNEYPTIQKNLETSIDLINSHIFEINKKINVSTPFLHDSIKVRMGRKKRRYFNYKWDDLYDGLHPIRDPKKPMPLLRKWMIIIQNAMRLNANLEDSGEEASEEETPWKRLSKRPRVE